MAERGDRLEREIVRLFKVACRANRPDVAEHLLRALETLEREPGIRDHARCHCALMEAYGELIRSH
ncbi:hypothetical protein [Mesorhizobium sp. L-8-3]|uniref:hypothetical protein n=1 Tax=Mesorhizobium sp. L-8-3 TaxID=2744522 RepID=UPI0019270EB7|nr:hypothetical protein [Mesorhizobium sp. L-8-3]BCH22112.1 hypothetical protein MesoLjLb_18970 [Mesorhizobium sp. L-8-3]